MPSRFPRLAPILASCALAVFARAASGCGPRSLSSDPRPASSGSGTRAPALRATDGRLEIRGTFARGVVKVDEIPMRTIELTFKNVSAAPLRLYLPIPDEFRANISTIVLFSDAGAPILIPEPQPHGYAIGEQDFFLLAPDEERTVTQSFTLDPVQPGVGRRTARQRGYEDGATVSVRWTYENATDTWPGGANTLDGVTKPLFGGQRVSDLWTGKLVATGKWTVTD